MINKKDLKNYENKNIEDFYMYIVESEINGNYSQVTELINKLSGKQFKLFCDWFEWVGINNTKPLNWFVNKRGVA